jgi:hypothetical protein
MSDQLDFPQLADRQLRVGSCPRERQHSIKRSFSSSTRNRARKGRASRSGQFNGDEHVLQMT